MPCKSIYLLLCLLPVLILFSGCSSIDDSLSAEEITQQLAASLSEGDAYIPCSDRYLSAAFELRQPFPEHSCMRDPDHSLDEFGVFACNDPSEAAALKNSINAALEKRRLSFDDRYFSEEKVKLDSATALSRGRYVLYTVLDPEMQSLITKQFNDILKGNSLSNGTQIRHQGQTNADG